MELFDFVVRGTPRTVQTKRSSRRQKWQEDVRAAATAAWPSGAEPWQGELSARIIFFFTSKTDIDVDNIIKPILDSLKGLAFANDNIIFEVTCRKTPQADGLVVRNAPWGLVEALKSREDFIFVRIGRGPDHTELPA